MTDPEAFLRGSKKWDRTPETLTFDAAGYLWCKISIGSVENKGRVNRWRVWDEIHPVRCTNIVFDTIFSLIQN